MTPLALGVIVACIAVLCAVLVSTLLALKKYTLRAESVLQLIEREIRHLAGQIESLTTEIRALSHHADEDQNRPAVVADPREDVSLKVALMLGLLGGLTRVGRYVGVAPGVKKGLDVFIKRLRDRH